MVAIDRKSKTYFVNFALKKQKQHSDDSNAKVSVS